MARERFSDKLSAGLDAVATWGAAIEDIDERWDMPKRINKVIELLEQGQPIYNTGTHDLSYENGKVMSQTWADYIGVDMEHGAFDMTALDEFMRGLVDGGPTPSGHRTPPVIMTIPTDGTSEEVIRANAWMMKQVLARGIRGILLCHAETPGAVKAFVESCRFPFQTIGVGAGLDVGRRGAGGQQSAAKIWHSCRTGCRNRSAYSHKTGLCICETIPSRANGKGIFSGDSNKTSASA